MHHAFVPVEVKFTIITSVWTRNYFCSWISIILQSFLQPLPNVVLFLPLFVSTPIHPL